MRCRYGRRPALEAHQLYDARVELGRRGTFVCWSRTSRASVDPGAFEGIAWPGGPSLPRHATIHSVPRLSQHRYTATVKDDVEAAIKAGILTRRAILSPLTTDQKTHLLEQLFIDLFGQAHVTLQKWGALTGQSAQVDTGYIAQFVASIVMGEPGQGFRGKGDDLADGSEVKSAANISGVDRPRWNHNMGKLADDPKRRARGLPTNSEVYLASPHLFYLLVDRPVGGHIDGPVPFRIRAWCLDAQLDSAWRDLVSRYVAQRSGDQYNLQLHPPVGYDDDIVVNTLGNLDFAEILLFDARLYLTDRLLPTVAWHKALTDGYLPISGRTKALRYGDPMRPSNLTDAGDLVADATVIAELFPELGAAKVEKLVRVTADELEHADDGDA